MWRDVLASAPIFDQPHYDLLDHARGDVVARLLAELTPMASLKTAIDVGCGLGYFSRLLQSRGLEVTAVDGRSQNVEEARRRSNRVRFEQRNAEDAELLNLGKFDLGFCFGLLYHLENPLLTIRNLKALTGKILLVESVIFPGDEPIMALIDEEAHEDQGLNHIAFYPTEACLIKMLYKAGFKNVFGLTRQPEHDHYRSVNGGRRVRTLLAASDLEIHSAQLVRMSEASSPIRPWDPMSGAVKKSDAFSRFTAKSLPEKVKSIKRIIKTR
jgi:2-polyprenyl-3-methyl-5-hydroxy-6-metoxy-1,4-benzoquinol methylase